MDMLKSTVYKHETQTTIANELCCGQVLSNGSLYVNKVFMEDAGKYGCMAGNNGGLEREEAYLHVYSGTTLSCSEILCFTIKLQAVWQKLLLWFVEKC